MARSMIPALVLAVAAMAPAYAQSIEVIAHPDCPVTTISRDELSKIFLKRLRTWSDRSLAVPVDQVPDSPVRQKFTSSIHRRSVVNIEVYWKRLIFSGRAVPPKEVSDDEAMIEFVRSTPGAVGYVDEQTPLGGVLRLQVTE